MVLFFLRNSPRVFSQNRPQCLQWCSLEIPYTVPMGTHELAHFAPFSLYFYRSICWAKNKSIDVDDVADPRCNSVFFLGHTVCSFRLCERIENENNHFHGSTATKIQILVIICM